MNQYNYNYISPKYLKVVRLGFFQRVINGACGFLSFLTQGISCIIQSPIIALRDFCIRERVEVDYNKLLRDGAQHHGSGPQEPTVTHRHIIEDGDEDWKRAHEELYKDDEDEDELG